MIWCVEDDSGIRDIEVYALTSTGFEAMGFEDGDAFWNALQSEKPELVLLDVMLPGRDGVELLKMMKASEKFRDIPVIMATAKGTEFDKIQSLDLGADDYLVKPFGVMEMVSRVKAVLRRCSRGGDSHRLGVDGLVLDRDEHTVTVDGERVTLTYKEYELLRLFLSRPGIAFTREQLLASVWNTEYMGETRTVDMHIRTLRHLLYELVYNLCDNAVKYNVPGGSVDIILERNKVTVSDTGIGIPAEHQGRVFERFYRVDKSHSRQSGGTGLGLSIVKHAAAYHRAALDMKSTPGKGTAITVAFP